MQSVALYGKPNAVHTKSWFTEDEWQQRYLRTLQWHMAAVWLWLCVLHPSAYELNRLLACKLTYVWNVGDVTSGSAFAAIFHRIIEKMSVPFVWCLFMPESCHLPRVCEHVESVNLTFGNSAQYVRIGHSESEMKKIHCSNCDAMWWKHPLTA